jgi:DNA-binding beta-propeller fold protein YncE
VRVSRILPAGAASLLTVLAVLAWCASALGATAAGTVSVVGEAPNGGGVFRFPQAIAFSSNGSQVFVGDQYSGQVQVFGRDGSFLRTIGERAARGEPGRLGVIGGVAGDRSGHLYVLDSEHNRVQVFAQVDGRFLASFGDASMFNLLAGDPAKGLGISASGIAVSQPSTSATPVVYVADQGNSRVARFVLDLSTLKPKDVPTFSDRAVGLSHPQGLAVNADGTRLYVADDDHHRVVVLDPVMLSLTAQVGSQGSGPGQFQNPYDVAVDAHNPAQLYVADNLNGRVDVFDAGSLAYLTAFGRPAYGPGTGNFEIVRAVGAVGDDPAGGVGVADTANNRVQVLDAAGNVTAAWGFSGRGPGYLTRPGGGAFAPDGSIAVADSFDQRVERFDPDGSYGGQFGKISGATSGAAQGAASGQFSLPFDVAYDTAGNLWVADTGNDRVQQLAPNGTVLYASAAGQLAGPRSVAAGPDGSVYVADSGHDAIVQITPGGGLTTVLAGLSHPAAVAWNGSATFAADSSHVLDALTGTQISPPDDEAAWDHPDGLAAATDGTLYVSELRSGSADGARVLRGTPAGPGTYAWETIAAEGSGSGQVIEPANLSLSPSGATLLIADFGNNRLLRLDQPGVNPPLTEPITVSIDQITRGTVTSDLPGISCVADCQQSFGPGRAVTLTARPANGSIFNGWNGACAGAAMAPTCTLITGPAQTAAASFAAPPPPPQPVAVPVPLPPPPPPSPPPPILIQGLQLTPRLLHPARRADHHRHQRARAQTHARLTVTLSRPAAVDVSIQQGRPGRRQGPACRAPTNANRHGHPCTRFVDLRPHRAVPAAIPAITIQLTPTLHGRALTPGPYRLTVIPTDPSGSAVAPRIAGFQVAAR